MCDSMEKNQCAALQKGKAEDPIATANLDSPNVYVPMPGGDTGLNNSSHNPKNGFPLTDMRRTCTNTTTANNGLLRQRSIPDSPNVYVPKVHPGQHNHQKPVLLHSHRETHLDHNNLSQSANLSLGNQMPKKWLRLCGTTIIAFSLLVVFNLAVSMLAIRLFHPETENNLCLPCRSFILSTDELDDYRDHFYHDMSDPHNVKCCVRTPAQLQTFMDVMVKRGIRQDIANSPRTAEVTSSSGNPTTSSHYAAQVFLDTLASSGTGRYETVRGWSIAPDVAFVRQGIRYDVARGRFTITSAGLYMVYSHVSFRGRDTSDDDEDDADKDIYSQKIVREKTYDGSLLTEDLVRDTEVRSCGDEYSVVPCYSSNIVTQLRLRQGDEIFVQVLRPNTLVADGRSSYFGLFMIT